MKPTFSVASFALAIAAVSAFVSDPTTGSESTTAIKISRDTVSIDLNGFPPCSLSCISGVTNDVKCYAYTIACICTEPNFFPELKFCNAGCPPEDQQDTIDKLTNDCRTYNASIAAAGNGTSATHAGISSLAMSTATAPSSLTRITTVLAPTVASTSSAVASMSSTAASASSTATGGAVRLAGSSFVAAAIGAVVFIL